MGVPHELILDRATPFSHNVCSRKHVTPRGELRRQDIFCFEFLGVSHVRCDTSWEKTLRFFFPKNLNINGIMFGYFLEDAVHREGRTLLPQDRHLFRSYSTAIPQLEA